MNNMFDPDIMHEAVTSLESKFQGIKDSLVY